MHFFISFYNSNSNSNIETNVGIVIIVDFAMLCRGHGCELDT